MHLVLDDGTPCHAPTGTMVSDGPRVLCHLCGGWYRSVLAHLPSHGWDPRAYRETFGLERGEPLEGDDTRQLRSAAMHARRAGDPRVRAGAEVGQEWVRSGALSRAAADAARGRRQPEQRRRKTLLALAKVSPEARADGTRRYAVQQLRATAADAAARLGYPDLAALVLDRVAAGASLAQVSREAGLHKDWLSRHLATIAPGLVLDGDQRWDARWLPAVRALGFADVAAYLTDRHVTQRRTVHAIATELGMNDAAVRTALARHGIAEVAHATSRARSRDQADAVAARFGFRDVRAYLADRRAAGLSWRAIAAECGKPDVWVRRHAR